MGTRTKRSTTAMMRTSPTQPSPPPPGLGFQAATTPVAMSRTAWRTRAVRCGSVAVTHAVINIRVGGAGSGSGRGFGGELVRGATGEAAACAAACLGGDVYLAGTVMLIFGMGLYGLFISNTSTDERPKWMKINSLDELKTKVGHVIVMILLVKMFERSKMVKITTGMDLLSYSVCIFLSSASLYFLMYQKQEKAKSH
ncbi:hypothetical protein ABZP36_024853 [Zizania latifolia]